MPTHEEAPQERSILAYTCLSVVTCGLFAIYWAYAITSDTSALRRTRGMTPHQNDSGNYLLLTLLTCGIYWFYAAGDELDELEQVIAGKTAPSNWGLIYLIACLVGMAPVAVILMQLQLNSLISRPSFPAIAGGAPARSNVQQLQPAHDNMQSAHSPVRTRPPEEHGNDFQSTSGSGGFPEFHDDGFDDFGSSFGASPDDSPSASDDIDWAHYGMKSPNDDQDGRHP